jgi:hypothetical protein
MFGTGPELEGPICAITLLHVLILSTRFQASRLEGRDFARVQA